MVIAMVAYPSFGRGLPTPDNNKSDPLATLWLILSYSLWGCAANLPAATAAHLAYLCITLHC